MPSFKKKYPVDKKLHRGDTFIPPDLRSPKKPRLNRAKASSRLCICIACQVEYGSCSLFKEYQLASQTFTPTSLRSSVLPPTQISDESDDDDEDDTCDAFITTNSVVAMAANPESIDKVWLVHVVETICISFSKESTDDYDHKIPTGTKLLKGHFLEQVSTIKDSTIFHLLKKVTYFTKSQWCIHMWR